MIENFLEEYTKLIAQFPDRVRVEKQSIDDETREIIIHTDKIDAGKLIGRDGRMINAIKTVINGYKAKDGLSYKVTVKSL